IFTPLILNELKKYNEDQQQEYIIEILKCFETLLTMVDSTLRMLNFSLFCKYSNRAIKKALRRRTFKSSLYC
ncbi:unnamed protein product, partial [Rotaria sp. Silwood1]